jgi:hypothetical protein
MAAMVDMLRRLRLLLRARIELSAWPADAERAPPAAASRSLRSCARRWRTNNAVPTMDTPRNASASGIPASLPASSTTPPVPAFVAVGVGGAAVVGVGTPDAGVGVGGKVAVVGVGTTVAGVGVGVVLQQTRVVGKKGAARLRVASGKRASGHVNAANLQLHVGNGQGVAVSQRAATLAESASTMHRPGEASNRIEEEVG